MREARTPRSVRLSWIQSIRGETGRVVGCAGGPKFAEDLDKNWAVVAEAIQTILRREGYPNPYEALKGLTRTNEVISKNSIHEFITTLEVSNSIKEELMRITPSNYLGI